MIPDLDTFALRLKGTLKSTDKDHPLKAEVICERWLKATGETITDRYVREAIHYLRTKVGCLIVSNDCGYWLTCDVKEFIEGNEHLKNRAIEIWSAYYVPLKKYGWSLTPDLFDDSVVKALIKEFEAQGV